MYKEYIRITQVRCRTFSYYIHFLIGTEKIPQQTEYQCSQTKDGEGVCLRKLYE